MGLDQLLQTPGMTCLFVRMPQLYCFLGASARRRTLHRRDANKSDFEHGWDAAAVASKALRFEVRTPLHFVSQHSLALKCIS